MSLLNFESERQNPRPKLLAITMSVAALALVGVLGNTLAANISINMEESVEFGQGIAMTSVCDDEITVTPIASFINGTGSTGAHYLTSLRLSGIDSSEGKCSGKTFVIKAFGENGLLELFNYTEFGGASSIDEDFSSVEVTDYAGDFVWTSGGTDGDDIIDVENDDITDTAFTINLVSQAVTITRTPLALATDVKKFTIETYAKGELTSQEFSSVHVGVIIVPGFEEFSIFPYESAAVVSESCFIEPCYPYVLIRDWIEVILDHPQSPFFEWLVESELTEAQFAAATTLRLESISGPNSDLNWRAYFSIPGQDESDVSPIIGSVIGFNGQTGVFATLDPTPGAPPLIFSVNQPLTADSVIGSLEFFLDAEDTVASGSIPIRNLFSIWDFPQSP